MEKGNESRNKVGDQADRRLRDVDQWWFDRIQFARENNASVFPLKGRSGVWILFLTNGTKIEKNG